MISYEDTEVTALVLKCRERDEQAFGELVRRYTPMMKKVVSLFPDSSFSSDELFCEACYALHSAIRTFDVGQKEVSFGLYARTCVHNKIVDSLRSRKNKAKIVDFDVDDVPAADPETAIINRERIEEAMKAAAELLSDYEYRVLLLHIRGYQTARIAKITGKTAKSVDNAKSRLFTKLRASLREVDDN